MKSEVKKGYIREGGISLSDPNDPMMILTYSILKVVEEAQRNGMNPTNVIFNDSEFNVDFDEIDILGYKVYFSCFVEKGKVILTDNSAILSRF